jgi:ferritin-like metal-binding protein YciE
VTCIGSGLSGNHQDIVSFISNKENSMSLASLEELFVHEIKDIYDAEKQILKALPKMAKAVDSDDLRAAIEDHHAVTEQHVKRLEKIFQILDKPARGKKCAGMEGLLNEGSSLLQEDSEASVLDAAVIGAAQKVEHYEIAAYGTLATYAKILGYQDVKELLGQTLEEEKETDEALSELAAGINQDALAGVDEEEGEVGEVVGAKRRR